MMVHACNFSAWEVEDQELNRHLCMQFKASLGYLPDDPVFKNQNLKSVCDGQWLWCPGSIFSLPLFT